MTSGPGVKTSKRNQGGVRRSRFRASAKKAKTSSKGFGSLISLWRKNVVIGAERARGSLP
jgi:hypothetical protein